jgi:hypothetical protein
VDYWILPTGPVSSVDFTVRDASGRISYIPNPVKVRVGQWNLIQLPVPVVAGGKTYLHDILRIFPVAGSDPKLVRATIGEIRVYGY